MAAMTAAAASQQASVADGSEVEQNDSSEAIRRQLLPDTPSNAPHQDGDADGGDQDDTLPSAPSDFPIKQEEEDDSGLPSVPGSMGGNIPSEADISPHSLPAPPSPPPAVQAPPPPITFSRPSAPPARAAPTQPSAPPAPTKLNGHTSIKQEPGQEEEEWNPAPANVDPTTIATAQKHAKWAISALNYEDLETARKELRLALQLIGG